MLRLRAIKRLGQFVLYPPCVHPAPQPSRCLATRGRPSHGKPPGPSPMLNEQVASLPLVRLISEAGTVKGEMTGRKAYEAAKSADLDVMLVHSGPEGSPSVVRLLDYATVAEVSKRNEYNQRKRKKELQVQNRKEGSLKQVRLSPSTGLRDFEMKMRQARDFLLDGHRVRVFMQFRRGQGRLLENAKSSLSNAAKSLTESGILAGQDKQKRSNKSGGKDGTSMEELFPKPEAEDGDSDGALQRKVKPLEVVMLPLPKRERDRLRADRNPSSPGTAYVDSFDGSDDTKGVVTSGA